MENFQDAVAAIVKALPEWEKKGLNEAQKSLNGAPKSLNEAQKSLNGAPKSLNEAQTCQAVILRLLEAAGYDIWNPFEVFPEKNAGKDIPDFIIFFEDKARFIIEAKFLGKELSETDKDQAVGYTAKFGLRWVILTNGRQWIFLDNNVVEKIPAEKVVLVLNLLEPREGEFLGILLDRQLWEAEDANERVAEKVQLIRITMKVSKILSDTGVTSYNQGVVKLVIEHAPLSEDKDVAKKNLPQIIELLLPQNTPLVETPVAPITQITPQATEEPLNVWQVLSINLRKLKSSSSRKYTIMLEGDTMNFAAIADIMEAVAETCLTCKTEQSLVFVAEIYKYSKRLLSNHRYIAVNKSFDSAVNKVVKKQLESLGLPKGCITISSNKTSYTVP